MVLLQRPCVFGMLQQRQLVGRRVCPAQLNLFPRSGRSALVTSCRGGQEGTGPTWPLGIGLFRPLQRGRLGAAMHVNLVPGSKERSESRWPAVFAMDRV